MSELTDEGLAAEDWKSLFLAVLLLFVLAAGYIVHLKLNAPVISYCFDDICIIERR